MNDYEKTISVQAIAFDVIKKSAEKYEYDDEFSEIGTGSSNTNQALPKGKYPFYTRSQEVYYMDEYEYDDEFGTYVRGIIDFENGISKAMADAEFALIKETLTIGGKE